MQDRGDFIIIGKDRMEGYLMSVSDGSLVLGTWEITSLSHCASVYLIKNCLTMNLNISFKGKQYISKRLNYNPMLLKGEVSEYSPFVSEERAEHEIKDGKN